MPLPLFSIKKELRAAADTSQAPVLARFFKTGKGEYAEGDRFLGVMVPAQRRIAKKYRDIPLRQVQTLLRSQFHEERLTALFILVHLFENGDEVMRKRVYSLYLRSVAFINNWDLVDTSAPHIVGAYLFKRSRIMLYHLAKSSFLWERRMAILATQYFIRKGDYDDTLKIAEMLVADKHDLIHKAVGWMLREVGNRSLATEEKFLREHAAHMPRTMLRYAIEKFPEAKRKKYLGMK